MNTILLKIAFVLALGWSALTTTSCRREPFEAQPTKSQVRILSWGDYVAPELLKQFEEETGWDTVLVPFDNVEQMYGRMQATPDQFDVVITGDDTLPDLERVGALRELDRSRLKGLEQLDPQLNQVSLDPNHRYSIPFHWGSFAVGYRMDIVGQPTSPSLAYFFENTHQGKVMVVDSMKEVMMLINAYQGRSMDDFSDLALEKAVTVLEALASGNEVEYRSAEEIMNALSDGTCDMALTYSGDIAHAAGENEQVKYYFPTEGAPVWIDKMVISWEAPNLEGAYAFLNFMLRPEVIAENSNYVWYPNCNKEATSRVNPELLADQVLVPVNKLEVAKPYPVLKGKAARGLATLNQRIQTASN